MTQPKPPAPPVDITPHEDEIQWELGGRHKPVSRETWRRLKKRPPEEKDES